MSRIEDQSRTPQPHYGPAIQDFWNWRSGKGGGSITSAFGNNNEFIPRKDLERYFSECDRLHNILAELFPQQPARHLSEQIILRDYIQGFATLLSIGRGHFIKEFVRHRSLRDEKLPFGKSRPDKYPQEVDDDIGKPIDSYPSFSVRQHHFCPPTFKFFYYEEFDTDCALPIIRQELKGVGGAAETYEIEIHPDYNDLHDSGEVVTARRPNVFALKVYGNDTFDVRHHGNELDAFIRLRQDRPAIDGLVTFYGSFVYDGTVHTILEFADGGTLEDYFFNSKIPPPKHSDTILAFWKSLCRVLNALARIHEITEPHAGADVWDGWHQDVTPGNILVKFVANGSALAPKFMLADLGLCHFKKRLGTETAADRDSRGTQTYGAPECCRIDAFEDSSTRRITPTVDVWSFGCVLSEAATWVVFGPDELKKFRLKRASEPRADPRFRWPDCFHDGTKVLKLVESHHEELRDGIKRSDKVTDMILDEVGFMLERQSKRPTANESRRSIQAGFHRIEENRRRSQSSPEDESHPDFRYESGSGSASPHDTIEHVVRSFRSDHETHAPRSPRSKPRKLTLPIPQVRSPQNTLEDMPDKTQRSQTFPTLRGDYYDHNEQFERDEDNFTTSPQQEEHDGVPSSPKQPRARRETAPSRPKTTPPPTPPSSPPQAQEGPSARRSLQKEQSNRAHSEYLEPRVELPYTSIDQLARCRWDRGYSLPHRQWITELINRDHWYLIDDSYSMRKHWDRLKYVLGSLVYVTGAKDIDPDGNDLFYMRNRHPLQKGWLHRSYPRDPKHYEDHVKERRPSDINSNLSDIDRVLESKLRQYVVEFQKKRDKTRPLSIYILTNGVWMEESNPATVISDFVRTLTKLGAQSRQVGIQFIGFGNDSLGKRRMEYLDTKLKEGFNLKSDIVDETRHDGNAWKMLLGAINSSWDQDKDKRDAGDPDEWKRLFGIDIELERSASNFAASSP